MLLEFFVISIRKIQAIVAAAAFFARQGGARHQQGQGVQIMQFVLAAAVSFGPGQFHSHERFDRRLQLLAGAPNTSPSSRELLAKRLAPWTPVAPVSPAAYKPGIEVCPQISLFTPPIMKWAAGLTGATSVARSTP